MKIEIKLHVTFADYRYPVGYNMFAGMVEYGGLYHMTDARIFAVASGQIDGEFTDVDAAKTAAETHYGKPLSRWTAYNGHEPFFLAECLTEDGGSRQYTIHIQPVIVEGGDE